MGLLDGLLGNSWDDPKTAAVMSLAQGLLSSPRAVQGLVSGVGDYGATLQAQKDRAMQRQMQQVQIAQALQKQAILATLLPDLAASGGSQQTQAPQLNSRATAALTQGAAAGSVGPTVANAKAMNNLPQQSAPSTVPQSDGTGGYPLGRPSPLNPFGAPGALVYMASQGDPAAQETLKTWLLNHQTTPEIKNNQWQGVSPDQARLMTLAKAAKDSEIERKSGNEYQNFFTGQLGIVPKLPENAQPTGFNQDGTLKGVSAVPNAQKIQGQNTGITSGADAAARFPWQTNTVFDSNGNPTIGTNREIFGIGGTPGAGGNGQPSAAPQSQTPGAPRASSPLLTRQTGLSPTGAALTSQGDGLLKSAQGDAVNNQQAYQYFDEINNMLKGGGKFGPMQADIARWKAMVPGVDLSGAQTNQDVIRKIAANLAGARGTRSDAELQNWQHAYPNGEMTNQAIAQVIPMLRQTLAVSDARANVLTRASGAGLDKLPQIANSFNQIASPSLVSDGRDAAAASRAGPQAVQQWLGQFRNAHPNDWQQRLQTIQQLDHMGAF